MIKRRSPLNREVPAIGSIKKRLPTYSDTDLFPFGKHKGKIFQDVPASYLSWLHENGDTSDNKLNNYIYNNWDAIQMELPENKRSIY